MFRKLLLGGLLVAVALLTHAPDVALVAAPALDPNLLAAGAFAFFAIGDTEDKADPIKAAADLKKVADEIKTFAEKAEKEIKANGTMSAETKAKVDELLVKHTALDARMSEVEQKLVRKGKDADEPVKSLGERVVGDDQVKAMMKSKGGRVTVEVKAITTGGSAGALVEDQRVPGVIALPQRRMTIRDLLTPGRTSSNAIRFVQETGFTNNADVVSEGTQKPESTIAFTPQTANVATIAHWIQASKQILDDAPMLTSFIDGRLRYGLAYVEETQLLLGDGTGENLLGLIPQATAFNPAFVPAEAQRIDAIRLAILQAVLAEYPATGIVVHPTDWAHIELTKDADGRYIFANPTGLAGPVMWGLPVVSTPAMTVGDFLTGAFRLGAQIFDREDATVMISTEDRDNFVKNMVTILGEERLTLAVYRPEAFIHGDYSDVSGVS